MKGSGMTTIEWTRGPHPGMQGRIPDELWIKEFLHAA